MMNYRQFARRYLFRGTLVLETGLHIGTGDATSTPSDAPVIRTPDGRPFIPGSSFKGAFRSTVERLAPTLGVKSCALMAEQGCIGPQGEEQTDFNKRRSDENWSTAELLAELDSHLCDTCKLFGSPYAASRVIFSDLLPPEDDELVEHMVHVRDGVAIDRDSETAVDRLKFDYEVVAATQVFEMRILLEDPTDLDLALICVGLSEFRGGFGYIGGKRSRGLGNCKIEDLDVFALDLSVDDHAERGRRLKQYVLGKTPEDKMTQITNVDQFLAEQLEALPAMKEAAHA